MKRNLIKLWYKGVVVAETAYKPRRNVKMEDQIGRAKKLASEYCGVVEELIDVKVSDEDGNILNDIEEVHKEVA